MVGTGEDVLIGGLIVSGSTAKQVILRAIGPSLADFGLSGVLQDPMIELHDNAGALIFSNDNWRDTQEAMIEATGLQPNDDREAAIVATLEPGAYTAIVEGVGGGTGVAVVAVYEVDAVTIPLTTIPLSIRSAGPATRRCCRARSPPPCRHSSPIWRSLSARSRSGWSPPSPTNGCWRCCRHFSGAWRCSLPPSVSTE